MARVTDTEVREIITTNLEHDLSQFITMATAMVDRVNTSATSVGVTLSAQELKNIEMYLAGHFYALRYPKYIEQRVGKSSIKLQGNATGMGLDSTFWGQQARALDASGTLSAMGGRRIPSITWLGKEST